MQDISSCSSAVAQNLKRVIFNSGLFLFRMGQYHECLQTDEMKYSYVTLGMNGRRFGAGLGICAPAVCTSQDINSTITEAFKLIQYPFVVFSIQSDIENYHYQSNWTFHFTIISFILVGILAFIATLFHTQSAIVNAFNLKEALGIFKVDSKSTLNILNGVRALAMMWVVFGHAFSIGLGNTVNTPTQQHIISSPFFLIIEAGLISVDVFFFLGGFFLVYVFCRQKSQSGSKYFLAILHRALRIWPAYITAMLFYYSIFEHLGSGPFWGKNQAQVQNCSHMYRSIFFYDNLYHGGTQVCLAWGWYLHTDFQLFLISLILLFIYSKHKRSAYFIVFILVILSGYLNITWTQEHNQKLLTKMTSFATFYNYYSALYIKPYGRCTTYFMGLIFGLFYVKNYANTSNSSDIEPLMKKNEWSSKIKFWLIKKRWFRIIVQWCGIALMTFVIFVPRGLQTGEEWDQIWHSTYWFFSRAVFILGVTLMVFPSMVGVKGSLLQMMLTNNWFNFMSKVSFCTYLVHMIVIYTMLERVTYDTYYTISNMAVLSLGFLVLCLFFGFLLTIFIEIPFTHLQKLITQPIKFTQPEKNKQYLQLMTISSKQQKTHEIVLEKEQVEKSSPNNSLLQRELKLE